MRGIVNVETSVHFGIGAWEKCQSPGFIASGTNPPWAWAGPDYELCDCRDSICLVSLVRCLIHNKGLINNY